MILYSKRIEIVSTSAYTATYIHVQYCLPSTSGKSNGCNSYNIT